MKIKNAQDHKKQIGYTPGPWSVDKYGVITGNCTSIAETYQLKWEETCGLKGMPEDHICKMIEEQKANGQLIASAPELLEALKELVDKEMIVDLEGGCYQRVINLISKSERE